MRQISTEELIQKGVTRYSLIIGISTRAREIAEYNDSMAIQPEHKPILQAAEEYMEGIYDIAETDDADDQAID